MSNTQDKLLDISKWLAAIWQEDESRTDQECLDILQQRLKTSFLEISPNVVVNDDTRPDAVILSEEISPDAVFVAVEKLRFYLSCEAELYLNIGKLLTLLTSNKRYKLYGSHIETKDDFLKEVGLKRSTAYVYMDVWKTFGRHLEGTTLSVPYRRLIEALPIVKSDDLAIEWIAKAQSLLPNDYKAEVHKAKTGVSDLECEHQNTESYLKCLDCGKWLRN